MYCTFAVNLLYWACSLEYKIKNQHKIFNIPDNNLAHLWWNFKWTSLIIYLPVYLPYAH